MEWNDLTPEQQRAFNRMNKAYKDCKKLGVYFANDYGTLYAYDSKKVKKYDDGCVRGAEYDLDQNNGDYIHSNNSIEIPGEWCDDSHAIILTNYGRQLLREAENDH